MIHPMHKHPHLGKRNMVIKRGTTVTHSQVSGYARVRIRMDTVWFVPRFNQGLYITAVFYRDCEQITAAGVPIYGTNVLYDDIQ